MSNSRDFAFTVEVLDHDLNHIQVDGRCVKALIRVGDIFTVAYRLPRATSLRDYEQPRAPISIRHVSLRVISMFAYGRSWDEIYPGLTARIQLVGTGGDTLQQGDILGTLSAEPS